MSVCLSCWRFDATAIFLWLFQFSSWLLHQKSRIKSFVWIDACVFFLCRIKKGKMAKILKGRFHPRNKKVYFSKLLMGISPYAFFHRVLNLCVLCSSSFSLCHKKMLQHRIRGVRANWERLCPFDLKTEIWIVLFFSSRQKKCGSLHRNCGNCSSFVHSYREIANRHHYIVTIGH